MLLPAVTLVAVAVALWGWGAYLVERPKAARERAVADRLRAKRVDTVQELQAVEAEAHDLRLRLGFAEAAQADAVRQFQQLDRWRVLLAAICRRTGIALPEDAEAGPGMAPDADEEPSALTTGAEASEA